MGGYNASSTTTLSGCHGGWSPLGPLLPPTPTPPPLPTHPPPPAQAPSPTHTTCHQPPPPPCAPRADGDAPNHLPGPRTTPQPPDTRPPPRHGVDTQAAAAAAAPPQAPLRHGSASALRGAAPSHHLSPPRACDRAPAARSPRGNARCTRGRRRMRANGDGGGGRGGNGGRDGSGGRLARQNEPTRSVRRHAVPCRVGAHAPAGGGARAAAAKPLAAVRVEPCRSRGRAAGQHTWGLQRAALPHLLQVDGCARRGAAAPTWATQVRAGGRCRRPSTPPPNPPGSIVRSAPTTSSLAAARSPNRCRRPPARLPPPLFTLPSGWWSRHPPRPPLRRRRRRPPKTTGARAPPPQSRACPGRNAACRE